MCKYLSLLLLLLLGIRPAFSQNLDSLLSIQRKADPQEKIYVQFDKAYYNPGETIWFKAYLFAGVEPSEKSKNFYAELLDAQGVVINQKTAPIIFSGASGSFDLDSNFNKPAVYFRAYTISALNSDTAFLFSKAIRVLSTKTASTKTSVPPSPPTISFLPEGGDWVSGLPATMAFLATNQQGLPVAIGGSVSDNTGTKVADLQTLHDGMGSFVFIPQEGKTYTATWKAEGKTYTTALPAAKSAGVTLKVIQAEGGKRFTVYRSQDATEAQKTLRIVATMNQHLAFQANLNLSAKTAATGLFPTKDLPSGILQITLFDAANKPLAERITFVNNHDYEFDGDAFIAQKNISKRGLNKVEISVSDTLPTNLSLAITDADLNEVSPMEDNIISHLLLTGDLRGKIVDPYYYFFSTDDSAAIYLDLVMLTHGWRRFNWDNVFAGKTTTPQFKESNYLSLSGQIAGMPPGSYSPDLQLIGILQTSDSATNVISLPVDRKGTVFTEGLVFYDKAKLFFNFNKKNLSFDKSMLMVDNGLRKGYKKAGLDSLLKWSLPDVSTATIAANQTANKLARQGAAQLSKRGLLEAVTVKAKTKTPKEKMEEKYVSGLFSGEANSFDLVNDPLSSSYTDIFQYLQGKVAGLQISTLMGQVSMSWRGGTPALYLNEMKVDGDMLMNTSVSDIAYVKVFRPGESIVTGGGGGVIAIYTRKGGDTSPNPNAKGLNAVQVMGYSPVKQFYSPDYATVSERDALDDVRSTLYWNPSIYLDKAHRHLRLQFYNSDNGKRFRLIMEGINTDGKLIHVEKVVSK